MAKFTTEQLQSFYICFNPDHMDNRRLEIELDQDQTNKFCELISKLADIYDMADFTILVPSVSYGSSWAWEPTRLRLDLQAIGGDDNSGIEQYQICQHIGLLRGSYEIVGDTWAEMLENLELAVSEYKELLEVLNSLYNSLDFQEIDGELEFTYFDEAMAEIDKASKNWSGKIITL